MKSFELAMIREYYGELTEPKTYKFFKDFDGSVEGICEGILLFPNKTARTNVMFKDSRGRFVSYKDIGGDIEVAMGLIQAFPKGE